MRESMFKGLWPSKRKPQEEVADDMLDIALERLTQSLQGQQAVCEKIRRRQSSGSMRLVLTVPPPSGLEAE